MTTGRPSEYDPELHCKLIIEFMGDPHGLSFRAACAKMGIGKSTGYDWIKKHKDFSDAVEWGSDLSLLFYEEVGTQSMLGENPGFRDNLWKYMMANRHGWSEKPKEESEEKTINVVFTKNSGN